MMTMPVIPLLARLRQQDGKFVATQGTLQILSQIQRTQRANKKKINFIFVYLDDLQGRHI